MYVASFTHRWECTKMPTVQQLVKKFESIASGRPAHNVQNYDDSIKHKVDRLSRNAGKVEKLETKSPQELKIYLDAILNKQKRDMNEAYITGSGTSDWRMAEVNYRRRFRQLREPYFFYASPERAEHMATHKAIRWSGGADGAPEAYQRGSFPSGAYATTIAPYRQDVSLADMATAFYSRGGRDWFDARKFVLFIGRDQYRANGYLLFDELASKYNLYMTDFAHISAKYDKNDPDMIVVPEKRNSSGEEIIHPYIPSEILATGDTLIPAGEYTPAGDQTWEHQRGEGARPLSRLEKAFLY